MKKRTIWTIASVMGFSFLALLYLQLRYIEEMVQMKQEQLTRA
jgi:two-component system phosphate regulon sensor histidine kinase PhoR